MGGSGDTNPLREHAYSYTHLYEWDEFLKTGVLSYYNKDDQWEASLLSNISHKYCRICRKEH